LLATLVATPSILILLLRTGASNGTDVLGNDVTGCCLVKPKLSLDCELIAAGNSKAKKKTKQQNEKKRIAVV
jgi:hypothetical protein